MEPVDCDDELFEAAEVADSDAVFEEHVSELLLPDVWSILPPSRLEGGAFSFGHDRPTDLSEACAPVDGHAAQSSRGGPSTNPGSSADPGHVAQPDPRAQAAEDGEVRGGGGPAPSAADSDARSPGDCRAPPGGQGRESAREGTRAVLGTAAAPDCCSEAPPPGEPADAGLCLEESKAASAGDEPLEAAPDAYHLTVDQILQAASSADLSQAASEGLAPPGGQDAALGHGSGCAAGDASGANSCHAEAAPDSASHPLADPEVRHSPSCAAASPGNGSGGGGVAAAAQADAEDSGRPPPAVQPSEVDNALGECREDLPAVGPRVVDMPGEAETPAGVHAQDRTAAEQPAEQPPAAEAARQEEFAEGSSADGNPAEGQTRDGPPSAEGDCDGEREARETDEGARPERGVVGELAGLPLAVESLAGDSQQGCMPPAAEEPEESRPSAKGAACGEELAAHQQGMEDALAEHPRAPGLAAEGGAPVCAEIEGTGPSTVPPLADHAHGVSDGCVGGGPAALGLRTESLHAERPASASSSSQWCGAADAAGSRDQAMVAEHAALMVEHSMASRPLEQAAVAELAAGPSLTEAHRPEVATPGFAAAEHRTMHQAMAARPEVEEPRVSETAVAAATAQPGADQPALDRHAAGGAPSDQCSAGEQRPEDSTTLANGRPMVDKSGQVVLEVPATHAAPHSSDEASQASADQTPRQGCGLRTADEPQPRQLLSRAGVATGVLPHIATAGGVTPKRAAGRHDTPASPADQLPVLARPDGQLFRGAVQVQGRSGSSRRSPIDHDRQEWGAPWSPSFPTERQIARRVDSMLREHERVRMQARGVSGRPGASGGEQGREREAAAAQRAAADAGPGAGAMGAGSVRAGSASAAGDWRPAGATAAPRPAKGGIAAAGGGSSLPSLVPSAGLGCAPARPAEGRQPRRRHEPAKIRHSDGRVTLRGVRSTSDLDRYAKGVNLQSRRGIEVRAAFKTMRSSQHAAVAQDTWNALYSLQASERPFDEWYASAKGGARFHLS
uniref:Uncharacterized protein n=1 Tax=Alexandrium monilatum TaxID=311494 RepID=A0A7S4SI68_9DINO